MISLARALSWIYVAPFLAVGWLAGVIFALGRLAWAALKKGFSYGNKV